MLSPSGSLRVTATGPAAPDEVWDRYTRPARWSSWAPHIREVDHPGDVVAPGSRGRVTGVGGLVAVFHVDAVDEAARTWTWSVRTGPLRLRFDHDVRPTADGGSTASMTAHGPWPVLLAYAPVARWALGRLVS